LKNDFRLTNLEYSYRLCNLKYRYHVKEKNKTNKLKFLLFLNNLNKKSKHYLKHILIIDNSYKSFSWN